MYRDLARLRRNKNDIKGIKIRMNSTNDQVCERYELIGFKVYIKGL